MNCTTSGLKVYKDYKYYDTLSLHHCLSLLGPPTAVTTVVPRPGIEPRPPG